MKMLFAVTGLCALFCCTGAAAADLEKCPGGQAGSGERYLVIISDLHMSNGRRADKPAEWHRTEDFRWDGALQTFVDRIDECGASRVDPGIHASACEGSTMDSRVCGASRLRSARTR